MVLKFIINRFCLLADHGITTMSSCTNVLLPGRNGACLIHQSSICAYISRLLLQKYCRCLPTGIADVNAFQKCQVVHIEFAILIPQRTLSRKPQRAVQSTRCGKGVVAKTEHSVSTLRRYEARSFLRGAKIRPSCPRRLLPARNQEN